MLTTNDPHRRSISARLPTMPPTRRSSAAGAGSRRAGRPMSRAQNRKSSDVEIVSSSATTNGEPMAPGLDCERVRSRWRVGPVVSSRPAVFAAGRTRGAEDPRVRPAGSAECGQGGRAQSVTLSRRITPEGSGVIHITVFDVRPGPPGSARWATGTGRRRSPLVAEPDLERPVASSAARTSGVGAQPAARRAEPAAPTTPLRAGSRGRGDRTFWLAVG